MTPQPVYDGALIVAASSVAITDIRGIERRLILSDFTIVPGFVIAVLEEAKRLREMGEGMSKTMYVRLDEYESRCGLLHCDDPAKEGFGVVQLGSGGPFEQHNLDDLTPISEDEFYEWLESL